MNESTNVGFLNRNQIKWIAIAAMLIDHIAWAFVPTESVLGQIMHFIGRLTAPTMAYFLAEGYHYTKNINKYIRRLLIFAVISWPAFVYFEFGCAVVSFEGGFWIYPQFGVIYTLLLGLMAIRLWDNENRPKWLKVLGVIGLCILSFVGDWPIYLVLWCLLFHIYRDDAKKKWTAYTIVAIACCLMMLLMSIPWWTSLFMMGVFLTPFLIQFCYNGEQGSKSPINKWFFYVFYPLHLVILGIIRWVLI